MEAKDGSVGFDFAGTYTKIVKHKLIEYSFGDRTARVEFTPGPQGVAVRVTFDSEHTHSSEQQRQGWQSILDNFARHVEAKSRQSSPRATVQPYLFFRGRCEEAIDYYKAKLDAEVLMQMRFKDNPEKPSADKVPREFDERIMHACVRIAGAELFMSDGMRSGPTDFDCVSLSLNLPTEAEAHRIFNALAADGKITMPIGKTFFAQCFGGVTDRFGVQWMVIVQPMP
jgi:PhnB protein